MKSGPYNKLAEPEAETYRVVEIPCTSTSQNSDSPQTRDRTIRSTVATILPYAENSTTTAEFVGGPEPRITLTTTRRKSGNPTTMNLTRRNLFIVVIFATIVVLLTALLLIAYFTAFNKNYNETESKKFDEREYYLGNGINIYTRISWGGSGILDGYKNRTLSHPTKLVIIAHTATVQCTIHQECFKQLRSIQNHHVALLNYLDTGYNFLIGGDGNIYQALGWDIQNYVTNDSIEIAFIGNYGIDDVTDRQRLGIQALLDHGIELGKLDKDYKLVGHNQVVATLSPGKHLTEEIRLWSHYNNGSFKKT